ncbi:MAG: mevalonate kinase [Anaerolineae bacterium]|nr:mevalonate kinase [Anaerolineae bacterium]
MPSSSASAPGKIILFGEHAVVYGQPAIAIPVDQVRATATTTDNTLGIVRIIAPDINLQCNLDQLDTNNPLFIVIDGVKNLNRTNILPACDIHITSTIPIASGMGSGAAVSVAVIRSLSSFLGLSLSDDAISALAFEAEKRYHGSPSGIDNTVISYNKPVYFVRGEQPVIFLPKISLQLVIASTGIESPTISVVQDVRARWQEKPDEYNALFEKIGEICKTAYSILREEGCDITTLGLLMTQNHRLLQQIDVSCPELDSMVSAALNAGALGAKLSGAGRGGNLIALVPPEGVSNIVEALRKTGAKNIICSQFSSHSVAG